MASLWQQPIIQQSATSYKCRKLHTTLSLTAIKQHPHKNCNTVSQPKLHKDHCKMCLIKKARNKSSVSPVACWQITEPLSQVGMKSSSTLLSRVAYQCKKNESIKSLINDTVSSILLKPSSFEFHI